jgi:hypothetical protein
MHLCEGEGNTDGDYQIVFEVMAAAGSTTGNAEAGSGAGNGADETEDTPVLQWFMPLAFSTDAGRLVRMRELTAEQSALERRVEAAGEEGRRTEEMQQRAAQRLEREQRRIEESGVQGVLSYRRHAGDGGRACDEAEDEEDEEGEVVQLPMSEQAVRGRLEDLERQLHEMGASEEEEVEYKNAENDSAAQDSEAVQVS